MINPNQLLELVIKPFLEEIGFYNPQDAQLVLATGIQESNLSYLKQVNGPALGIYQMEPETHDYLVDKYENKMVFLESFDIHYSRLLYDLGYASILCRLKYFDNSEKIPAFNDIPAMAAYWKKYYNTYLGKGKEQDFIDNYYRVMGKPK